MHPVNLTIFGVYMVGLLAFGYYFHKITKAATVYVGGEKK